MSSVGEALMLGLAARGVDVVFGIPGVHTIELYRGLPGSGIRHVTPRHEGGAGFMADGYARVSGKPGVALVITGPGVTNILTPMGQARADSVPMLVISGVNPASQQGLGLGLLHELPDQAAMVRALCPTRQIRAASDLTEVLDWAFATLTLARPGPVHIEVPTDVMLQLCPTLPDPAGRVGPAAPDPAGLAAAAVRLNGARRVVILAGGGARGCEAPLRALAERLDAPVVQTVNARGLLHGHALSVPASISLNATRALIVAADQVLAIGTEVAPTDYDMYKRGGVPDLAGMIRIDISADQLACHRAAVKLQADAGTALAALLPLVTARAGDGAARSAAARRSARAELADLSPAMPGQLAIIEAIRDTLPGAIIVGDSTQPVYAGNLYYDHDRPGGWFNASTGFGALGYGLPAAIGAAIADPIASVVCLTGDGGLQFSLAELLTARDEALNITFLVWNNHGYREIADAMRAAGVPVLGCDPTPPLMAELAAACGLPFQSVLPNPDELAAALRSKPAAGPRLIEIRVN